MGPGIVSLFVALSLCPLLLAADPDRPGDGPPGLHRPPWGDGWGNRPKPGECPEDVDYPKCSGGNNNPNNQKECDRDRECDGKKKCCFSSCRNRCLEPLQDKGDFCPYFDDSFCKNVRPLPAECNRDRQCKGTDRCCSYNCRQQCTPTVKVKPGNCPPPQGFCPHHGGGGGRGSCTSDRDCPGDKKCCAPRCRRECVSPYVVNPGKCPEVIRRPDSHCRGPPPVQCESDGDCLKRQKCCNLDCWNQCVNV
ncbi:whey acidic protein [Xenopus laevis]|uniref:Whey acidic protein n=2 Tax=Xenopus laevis TaxID=8355 RepID=A0A310TNJ3_XENLA|nr:whey acidic protein [Xenopus laevis]OCT56661.1 hypothetical protein XELAEV_18004580mg [Xenopus laevis]